MCKPVSPRSGRWICCDRRGFRRMYSAWSPERGRCSGRRSLELGGKNPAIVLADADLDAAVYGAIQGCFASAGQVCVSIERIYVHESIAERFLGRLVERTCALKLAASLDYSMEVGSLTGERQMQHVEEHVRDAVEKGAVVLAGGRRRPDLGPLFYEPTILTQVTEQMLMYAGETFGPVVAVYPFAGESEAVERANATRYGLDRKSTRLNSSHLVISYA